MEKIKEKMNQLRLEADDAHSVVEELKNKVKTLEHENMQKEQEITSLTHRNNLMESQLEKMEVDMKEAKEQVSKSAQHDTQNEALQRRVHLLEEENEKADKELREAHEQLRQTDVKAGHFERKVQALQSSNEEWEKKHEELTQKHRTLQKELDDLSREISAV